jgi:SAM-dependent methyltransferase
MTELPADFWENRFQQQQTPWERGGLNPAFLSWRQSGALAPCRILVPGAGRSPEPLALLEAGFDVVALDLAQSAIATQRERLGAGRAVLADVTTWQPDAPFDAVYDQTCLCALPPPLWPAYAASLRRWVRPGGRLFILFMQSTREGGPPFDCPMPAMRTLFADWTWPDTLSEGLPHGLGTVEQPAVLVRPEAGA